MLAGRFRAALVALVVATAVGPINADRLELRDGRVLEGCYVRDMGSRLEVWRSLDEVGGPPVVYRQAEVLKWTMERGDEWDVQPDLPDLTVTYIELNPKLAGLHGNVDYDHWGRPRIRGSIPATVDIGDRAYLEPEEVARNLKLSYKPGEPITLTAHVRNVGFARAEPFDYEWRIDGVHVASGRCGDRLPEMAERSFELRTEWLEGRHTVTFAVITDQPEIATVNNEATDPLWGFGLTFLVSPGRVAAWHENRSAYGTFSWEDYYRWHIDIMNVLFEDSVFPSSPEGCIARVRLDRIVYCDDVEREIANRYAEDGIIYDQGAWIWIDDQDRNRSWEPPAREWRNQTEWSLPHELGHQLGLVDWYAIDYAGHEYHVMPDNGDKVTHFQTHPIQMMHWHGPHVWGEVDVAYLNMTWNKPRGHFGDHYFAVPRECYVRVVDVNGIGVPNATVEAFQRGVVVDPEGQPGEDHGVRYYPVIEDGDFGHPVSKDPVIVGATDEHGLMRLPNRPVMEVRTLNGFHRQPNPFGNMNVVGGRCLMLIKVTKDDRPCYYWLELYELNVAWFRGQRDRYEVVLKTPYGSASSPVAPLSVSVERVDADHVRVTWEPGAPNERHYLDRAIGFRVYRRISSDGLNDRPWFAVATVGPQTREVLVDMREYPDDIFWFSRTERFAVSAVGECGLESALTETLLVE